MSLLQVENLDLYYQTRRGEVQAPPKLTRLEPVTFMLQSSPHQIPKESSNREEIGQ